jgi:hypothetical protein
MWMLVVDVDKMFCFSFYITPEEKRKKKNKSVSGKGSMMK